MNPAINRIMSDMKDLMTEPLDNTGIYIHYDEENIMNMMAMIIGPEKTPYEDGYFFFKFTFPETYPLEPPEVKYMTQFKNIRYNPNLYTNGKVCLSLINTWGGPSWTACNTVRSVLVSLQALVFIEYPLRNEPGYQHAPEAKLNNYNRIIEYATMQGAILNILEGKIPDGFEIFIEEICNNFMKKYKGILCRAYEFKKKYQGQTFVTGIYSLIMGCDYEDVIMKLEKRCINMNLSLDGIEVEKKEKPVIKLSMTCQKLRGIAIDNDIAIKKVSTKTNKMIYKTKAELIQELNKN